MLCNFRQKSPPTSKERSFLECVASSSYQEIITHLFFVSEISGLGKISINFVEYGKPPKNDKERLQVCHRMHAHTQYCMSGDCTLEAAYLATKSVVEDAPDADDYFVFLISDANLRRYGIQPLELGRALTQNPKVHAYAFFIASLGDEAVRLAKEMPLGTAHVCLDPTRLPPTFKQIFTTSMFKDLK